MKNIVDVLRQKEAELQRVQKEIDALRIAMELLSDEGGSEREIGRPLAATGTTREMPTRKFP